MIGGIMVGLTIGIVIGFLLAWKMQPDNRPLEGVCTVRQANTILENLRSPSYYHTGVMIEQCHLRQAADLIDGMIPKEMGLHDENN